ncbi:MAG: ATP-dependent DNA helicase [Candidatus Woesearchaeota archaeon]
MEGLEYHFSHDSIREGQRELADTAYNAILKRKTLFADAPTGIGKTAAVLCPAATYAMRHKKKVLFLTSRHTQHEIAIQTLRKLSEKEGFKKEFNEPVRYADIIAKKSMCALSIGVFSGSDFISYCKNLREHDQCEYYTNTRTDNGFTVMAKYALKELESLPLQDSKTVKNLGISKRLCPYELAVRRIEDSQVIIADYNHLFHPRIRRAFLSKSRIDLNDMIIICDEAHNLPTRIRNMISSRISNHILDRAIRECQEYERENGSPKAAKSLEDFQNKIMILSKSYSKEDIVVKESISNILNSSLVGYDDIDELVEALNIIADYTRSQEKPSYCSTIVQFIEDWKNDSDGILRMIRKEGDDYSYIVKAMDPSTLTSQVIEKCHSFIALSGTLRPLEMFSSLLGAEDAALLEVKSPFPKENRLDVIMPRGTTKYSKRTNEMISSIASTIEEALSVMPGNVIVFFPSYYLLESISSRINSIGTKKLLTERRSLSYEQKKQLLQDFRHSYMTGSVLFSVVSGSFGEGIDLTGDLLRGVIVVGLPFEIPDLETKSLIEYYNDRFGKGWEYAYIYPAFNRVFQNAGRLIRTADDKGVVLYIDERYAWTNYRKLLDNGKANLKCINPKDNGKLQLMLSSFYNKG